jgi:hypothetical protein
MPVRDNDHSFQASEDGGPYRMNRETFSCWWKEYFPYAGWVKNETCICDTCADFMQQLRSLQLVPGFATCAEAKCVSDKWDEHLHHATSERKFYLETIQQFDGKTKREWFSRAWTNGTDPATIVVGAWRGLRCSFDYAEGVTLPHHVGVHSGEYFKSGYRIGLFAIVVEGWCRLKLPAGGTKEGTDLRFVFAIPEEILDSKHGSMAKGASMVVAMLWYFLQNVTDADNEPYKYLQISADNCSGQNKNRTMIHFLCWLVHFQGYHFIRLSFMVVGHTKFSPDRVFGLIKMTWALQEVETYARALEVFAMPSERNIVIDVRNIPCHNWKEFFEGGFYGKSKLLSCDGISTHHHFEICSLAPAYGLCMWKKVEGYTHKNGDALSPADRTIYRNVLLGSKAAPTALVQPQFINGFKNYSHLEAPTPHSILALSRLKALVPFSIASGGADAVQKDAPGSNMIRHIQNDNRLKQPWLSFLQNMRFLRGDKVPAVPDVASDIVWFARDPTATADAAQDGGGAGAGAGAAGAQ